MRDSQSSPGEPAETRGINGARLAATVLLIRDSPSGIEVFAQERVSTMRNYPGVTVFPGGGVDYRDFPPRCWDSGAHWTGPSAVSLARTMGVTKDKAHALVFAAVREVFEESGILLAVRANGSSIDCATSYHYARELLETHKISLSEFLADEELKVRSDLLSPWARWVGKSDRTNLWFDTFSFVARAPSGQRDGAVAGEADDGGWFSPQLLLDGWRAGLVRFVLPTWAQLTMLSHYDSVAEVMDAVRDVPIHPVMGEAWNSPRYHEFFRHQPIDRIGRFDEF